MTFPRSISAYVGGMLMLISLIVTSGTGLGQASASTAASRLTAFESIALPLPEGAIRGRGCVNRMVWLDLVGGRVVP